MAHRNEERTFKQEAHDPRSFGVRWLQNEPLEQWPSKTRANGARGKLHFGPCRHGNPHSTNLLPDEMHSLD